MTPSTRPTPLTPKRLLQFAFGFAPALIIDAAAKYHLFEALDHGPKNLEEMNEVTGASMRGLQAILNALVGLELLKKDSEGVYSLTPESAAFLVRSHPQYHGQLFHHVSSQIIRNWLQLPEILGSGQPARATDFEYQEGSCQQFAESLFGINYAAAQVLAEMLEISTSSGITSVLDIAAGSGVWSIALAQRSANVYVRAIDYPDILPIARQAAKRYGVDHQYVYEEGDLLAADFGKGHQIAILGHTLHRGGSVRGRALLGKSYAALAPGGLVVIADWLPNIDRTAPVAPLLFAVHMLVHTSEGDTFPFSEIRSWLEETGFEGVQLLDAPAVSPLILATKPWR